MYFSAYYQYFRYIIGLGALQLRNIMFIFIKKHRIESILALFVLVFIVYFSWVSINRLNTFRSNYFDLGIMDQVVYNTSRGRFLEMTNQDLKTNASRFAIHFDPLLAVFAPIYLIYPNPIVLLVAQAIAIGLGAVAVYLIGVTILKNKLYSLLFAVSYLFYFPNQRAVIFDVHAVVFATAFLLFTIYFSLVKKYIVMLVFIVLSLLTKEHVGMITFLFGLYMFFFQKERKYSLIVMTLSIFFFLTTFLYIIPQARQAGHFALRYFEDVGDSPTEIIINLFKNPTYIWNKLTTDQAKNYLIGLFIPQFVFMVFAPVEFLIALPELAINLISTNGNMRAIYFHYNAVLIPFIYFSAITGFHRMKLFIQSSVNRKVLITLYIVLNIFFIYKYAPLPIKFFKEPYQMKPIDEEKMGSIREWQTLLADDSIPVATSPQIAPFFTGRTYFYNFLYDTGFQGAGIPEDDIISDMDIYNKAKYIILSISEVDSEGSLSQKFYNNLKENADYKVVYTKGDIIVYRR